MTSHLFALLGRGIAALRGLLDFQLQPELNVLMPTPSTNATGDWVIVTRVGGWPIVVRLPEGTELRMLHNGVMHFGRVDDGALAVNGKRFTHPSPAARAITGHRGDNGWHCWEFRRPGETSWQSLNSLRYP